MNELKFRTLKENEIECRVGTTIKKKDQYGKPTNEVEAFYLLLYKNARVDQMILDETFGAWNWQCKYYQVKNTMVCSVGIRKDEKSEWIWKDNGGDDDFTTEQVKAELSDAFKRACFNWGIGRELYYSPKIYIKATSDNHERARYSVKVIQYDQNKRITNLAIINDKTKEVVFLYGKDTKVAQNGENDTKNVKETDLQDTQEEKGSIDKNDLKPIQAYVSAMSREDSRKKFYAYLDEQFGTMSLESLTLSQGKKVLQVFAGRNKQ